MKKSVMETEEHVSKICQMFGVLLLFCTAWLWVPGMDAGAQRGMEGSVGCAGGGGRKWKGEATATSRELCQLRNNGVVCLSLAGYQVKVLWCEFICWLFPVHDVISL